MADHVLDLRRSGADKVWVRMTLEQGLDIITAILNQRNANPREGEYIEVLLTGATDPA